MITIDMENSCLYVEDGSGKKVYQLSDPKAFDILSEVWLRSGWDNKYVYSFSWFGRPIIQLPEDMIRLQEVIYSIKPDLIIETGIAHGGSLVYYASLCKAMGKGQVVGVDIEIRPHNRSAIENHELFEYITLLEGSSTSPEITEALNDLVKPGKTVLVILDSNHTKEHVLEELRSYSKFVSIGSFLVACDGIMGHLRNAPRTQPDWSWNNPEVAAQEFVRENDNFVIEEPEFPFNEGNVNNRITYWPSGFLRRIK